ncbi:glycerate kinase [Tamlana sp. 2201CG12-4]|uniref:glycerate kinase n=1 Tax=Tamlana sp. 2201CG12-4 TaxID=3112582 RepID=UPI002DB82467|nr:glycerate kinase [Tamlana sp. 2201CG12-4]MEC3906595.1 glycerate kinase [Tamlana sp. 2201CG12-4]
MKIVLAPDKFKNSLTGLEFCSAVKAGIHAVDPGVTIVNLPLADGGDGTIEVVNYYLKGEVIHVTVNNPFFEPIQASYLFSKEERTAFIEMAEASGVKLLKPEQFDCKNATTLGTGEMIIDAINRGASKIILGIGGSATNDCGVGMATALGYRFLDKHNNEVLPVGANLSKIESIDVSNVHPELFNVSFRIACDVTNPLFGEHGAACVYAAQKGASPEDIKLLDEGLEAFSEVINAVFNIDVQAVPGAGAAGGMGIASKVFLKGVLEPGVQLIKHLAQFDSKLENADWIITGEGKLDSQTLSGKTIEGVANSARIKNIKVAAFCGMIDLDEKALKAFGIEYSDAVLNHSKDLEDAMKNGYDYLKRMAFNFVKEVR